jgi:hypothetical protein
MLGHVDWLPWIPTFVALAGALLVVGLVLDVGGMAHRLTPGAHAFFGSLPPLLRRLWFAAVVVALALIVLWVMALTVSPGWLSFVVQASEVLFAPIGIGVIVVVGVGRFLQAHRAWRGRQQDRATLVPASRPSAPPQHSAAPDLGAAAGRALGRLVARASQPSVPKSPGSTETDLSAAAGRALGRWVARSPRVRDTLDRTSRAFRIAREPRRPEPPPKSG